MNSKLSDVFSSVSDPRRPLRRLHKLNDILLISVLAIICGAETWNNIEEYAQAKKAFLKKFLELPNGIPSHDTFNRVFAIINPEEFEQSFMDWVASIVTIKNGELVSLDGKTIRGAKSKGKKSPFHVVSAWAHQSNMVLGQLMTDEKSNEITAIPKLIELLELEQTVITIDAMGCQENIATKIIDNQANYILAVKNNQKNLFEDIEFSFNRTASKKIDVSQTLDGDHGRIETRTCSVISDMSDIENTKKWKNLSSIIKIESTREFKNSERSTETSIRYYISSVEDTSTYFQHAIRSHWAIENKLHWTLDVAFGEDASRKRTGNAARNFSTLLKIALNLLKNEKSTKVGVKGKRLKAGWDEGYLIKVLNL
jgi:predicted transposase YbfD/YdcC